MFSWYKWHTLKYVSRYIIFPSVCILNIGKLHKQYSLFVWLWVFTGVHMYTHLFFTQLVSVAYVKMHFYMLMYKL